MSEPTGISIIPVLRNVIPPVQKMKRDWRAEEDFWGIGYFHRWHIQVVACSGDKKKNITKSSKEHEKDKSNTKQVILPQDVQSSSICSNTDFILMNASDKFQHFYAVEVKCDKVALKDFINQLCRYNLCLFISLATWPTFPGSNMVLTFQFPILVLFFGFTIEAVGFWSSFRLWPKSVILLLRALVASPLLIEIRLSSVSVISWFLREWVIIPQPNP